MSFLEISCEAVFVLDELDISLIPLPLQTPRDCVGNGIYLFSVQLNLNIVSPEVATNV